MGVESHLNYSSRCGRGRGAKRRLALDRGKKPWTSKQGETADGPGWVLPSVSFDPLDLAAEAMLGSNHNLKKGTLVSSVENKRSRH